MEDARGRRHPLHVAGADQPAGAGGVAVRKFAPVDDGHRLETPVWMLTHTSALGGRWKIMRPGKVEQQEGAYMLAQAIVGKQRANREAVPHPMGPGTGVDAEDLLHCGAPEANGSNASAATTTSVAPLIRPQSSIW
ncbi:hypothetical protein FQZ97_869100 [compost metagenome]